MQNTKKIIQYFPAFKTSNPSTKNLKQAIDKKNSINALMKQKIKKNAARKSFWWKGSTYIPVQHYRCASSSITNSNRKDNLKAINLCSIINNINKN